MLTRNSKRIKQIKTTTYLITKISKDRYLHKLVEEILRPNLFTSFDNKVVQTNHPKNNKVLSSVTNFRQ